MMRWFRPRAAPLPLSSRELTDALRAAARFADDAAQRIEYEAAADALDRATMLTARHGDAPTRDALSYALGRAQLDLKDQLTELIDLVKTDRTDSQDLRGSIAALNAAMEGMFSALTANLSERRAALDDRITVLEQVVRGHDDDRDRSVADRQAIRAESAAEWRALDTRLDHLAAALRRVEAALEVERVATLEDRAQRTAGT